MKLAVRDGLIQQREQVEPQSKLERKILMNAFMKLAPEEILDVQAVKVTLDRPLHSPRETKQYCIKCGEELGNAQGTGTLCIACLKGAYYQPL
jgi:formylmethanofuran dehydrogenase subunit E